MYKKLKNKFGKATALVISLALAVTLTVAGSLAYLVTHTEEVINYFTPARVTCEVMEDFVQGGTEKEDIKIKNTGTTDAYIRVAIVANWYEDGMIVAPHAVSLGSLPSGWVLGVDGYYYYTSVVPAGGSTGILINSYPAPTSPTEFPNAHLEMTIIAQAIQSTPTSVVVGEWSNEKVDISVSNGSLTITNKEVTE